MVWHRRAGKDEVCLHWTATQAVQKPGTYWHMLPEASQARKAIWEAINPHTGLRRIKEVFPSPIVETLREQEMMIRLKNGATWQVVGSDNFDSLVGSPPIGIVFSEWAIANKEAWAYLRPILAENGGWAIFNTTPRGQNHAEVMCRSAAESPEWYAEVLNAKETGVFTLEQLAEEKAEMIREYGEDVGTALFEQEYFCSFTAAVIGAYYGKEIGRLESQGRITSVPHDPAYPVCTTWDLGLDDNLSVWLFQEIGMEVRFLEHVSIIGAVPEMMKELKERPYTFGTCYLPHDAEPRSIASGKSIKEVIESLGFHETVIAPRGEVEHGINAVRQLLPKCMFDAKGCERGLHALRNYQREFNRQTHEYKARPKHDWASHPADSLRTYATAKRPETKKINYHQLYG